MRNRTALWSAVTRCVRGRWCFQGWPRAALAGSCPILAALSAPVAGQTLNWTNPATGTFNVAANWSPATVPSLASHTAVFAPGTTSVLFSANASHGTLLVQGTVGTFSGLTLNRNYTLGALASVSSGTLTLGSSLTLSAPSIAVGSAGTLRIGPGSTLSGTGSMTINGVLDQVGGGFTFAPGGSITVSGASARFTRTSSGSFNQGGMLRVLGGGSYSSAAAIFGSAGTGTLLVEGIGSRFAAVGDSFIGTGTNNTGFGSFSFFSAGTFQNLAVGQSGGTGTLLAAGSTFTVNGNLDVGVNGGTGTMVNFGGVSTFVDSFVVGVNDGAGTISLTDGTFTTGSEVSSVGSGGTLSITGGRLNLNSALTLQGKLVHAGGTIAIASGRSISVIGPAGRYEALVATSWGRGGLATVNFANGSTGLVLTNLEIGAQDGSGFSAVQSGSALTIGGNLSIGTSGAFGVLRVQDPGSSVTMTAPTATLTLGANTIGAGTIELAGGTFTAGGGTVTVRNTGRIRVTGGQFNAPGMVAVSGQIDLAGGTLRAGSLTGLGSLNFSAGTLSLTASDLVVASDTPFAGSLLLTPGKGVEVSGDTLLPMFSTLIIDGGRLSTRAVFVGGGAFQFNSGTLALTGSDLTISSSGPLGSSLILTPSRALEVAGTMHIPPGGFVTVEGGRLSVGSLVVSGGHFGFDSGTLRLTGSDLVIGAGGSFGALVDVKPNQRLETAGAFKTIVQSGAVLQLSGGAVVAEGGTTNAGQIVLASPLATLGGGTLTNSGLLTGTGQILAPLANQSSGEIRITSANQIRFGGSGNANGGLINLLGGVADFSGTLANGATGRITGRGMLATAGLLNAGTIALSAGASDVFGPLANTSTGRTIVTGNATAVFYDALTNDPGSEFRVSTGSTAVFFGHVTGLSQFTGPGLKIFEGTTAPGALQSGGDTRVGPAGNVIATRLSERGLAVEGHLSILPNGTPAATSTVQVLELAPGGVLDLTNNAMVVDYTSPTPLPAIRAAIQSAYAGGSWSGDGITSSLADASQFALGYAEAAALPAIPPIFGPVDDTAVLIRLTRYGDANLDGAVNLADFNRLAANFGGTSKQWWEGDFNYDGLVNLQDFNRLAANFGLAAGGPEVTPDDWSALAAAVPEPSALSAIAGACTLLARRRRVWRISR